MKTHTSSRKRRTVVLSLWVKPVIKAEVKRLAEQEGMSISKCAGALLEEALHQKLHIQHAVLLQPLIEQAISRRMAAISTRLSSLLVRGVLDIGQVRRLVINLLACQPGMTQETLEEIIDDGEKGGVFYRIIISPDPNKEDTQQDLRLREITEKTMHALEDHIHKHTAWVGAVHADHTQIRHVHVL